MEYSQILEEILKPEHFTKSKVWLKEAQKADIEGLRIIALVMKHKGQKRFKKPVAEGLSGQSQNFKALTHKKAQKQYNDLIYGSSYERFFGGRSKVKTFGEAEILKFKLLSQLKISSILNQQAVAYLESWVLLKEDEKFVNMALGTIRKIYSFLNSFNPASTTQRESFKWAQKHDLMSPTRFDTIVTQVKVEQLRSLPKPNQDSLPKSMSKPLFKTVPGTTTSAQWSPQELRDLHFKGNKNLIVFRTSTESATTSYMHNYRGLMQRYPSKPLFTDHFTSCSTGTIQPDPFLMTMQAGKTQDYRRDLQRVSSQKNSLDMFLEKRDSQVFSASPTRTFKYW